MDDFFYLIFVYFRNYTIFAIQNLINMKLELKHLAPYLPYRVKVSSIHYLTIGTGEGNGIGSINHVLEAVNKGKLQYRPILRPLSDLTKDLSIGNDIINFQSQFNQYDFEWLITSNNKRKLINSLDYFIVNKMFEYHFDVFGLIEQGLAIDINTLSN